MQQCGKKKFQMQRYTLFLHLKNFHIKEVFNRIVELLPESPPFYPKDQLTDKPERFFVNEIVREKILIHYKKEIPYSVGNFNRRVF